MLNVLNDSPVDIILIRVWLFEEQEYYNKNLHSTYCSASYSHSILHHFAVRSICIMYFITHKSLRITDKHRERVRVCAEKGKARRPGEGREKRHASLLHTRHVLTSS